MAICCSQRVAELAVARLHLFEEADVLDGDHRLVGEGLQELDLLVAERAHLGATDHQRADRLALAQERDGQNGAEANPTGDIAAGSETRLWQPIGRERAPEPDQRPTGR